MGNQARTHEFTVMEDSKNVISLDKEGFINKVLHIIKI